MVEDALAEIIPWFRRPPTAMQRYVAEALTGIWLRDPEVAAAAARAPMFTDPNRPLHPSSQQPSIVSRHDRDAILTLAAIAEADRETALALTGSAWFGDGIEYEENGYSAEGEALQLLLEMAQLSPELTRAVLGLDWVADGFPHGFSHDFDYETATLKNIIRLAKKDVELAVETVGAPWVVDGITSAPGRVGSESGISDVDKIAEWSPELARQILTSVSEEPVWDRNLYMLRSLGTFSYHYREKFERLISQP